MKYDVTCNGTVIQKRIGQAPSAPEQPNRVAAHGRSPQLAAGIWWALVRGPYNLPVLFTHKRDAVNNCDPDEYLVKVEVRALNPRERKRKTRAGVPHRNRENK